MHSIHDEPGLVARDCVCGHGRRSPVFAGEYRRARIAVNLAGAFHARSSGGEALIAPSSMLVGNPAAAYEFRHVDDGGDRSIVFEYGEALLDEVAGCYPGRHRAAAPFRRVAIPPSAATTEVVVLAEEAVRTGDREAVREAALVAAGAALTAGRDAAPRTSIWSPAHARRVARSVRFIEVHSAGDCSLETLAAEAGVSRYHFLRLFRAMTGQTPRQALIAVRLRAAANDLRASRKPVTEVALDAGFGDLSHFTTSFSRAFGVSPRAYRLTASRGGGRTRPAPR
jgi:AraC-like DNA-binding protein